MADDISSGRAESADSLDQATLKYHLLGPSLTKAGQDSVDQQKVSEIIYNASKGSKYFSREEERDRELTEKICRIVGRKKQLDTLDLATDRRKADELISELELSRDLTQTVVHVDCDAFYAAVEELDRPELKDVPMAVGKGVLTTCNYHARKFGCRSGMAGFVAMKLCPQLICLPLNFEKYTAKAQEVRAVLAKYDPTFESASIDEAYLNITEYCNETGKGPEEAVLQMREEVYRRARITVSAGIAANARLAKICSNKNKPNGQFCLPNDRSSIMSFMRDLPTRKVNGVGRVFERELDAIGIKTCGDLYEHRSSLSKLFGEKAFRFFMSCYLGLGKTHIRPAEQHERKSVGTESTFRDMVDTEQLHQKLRHTAEELEKDLRRLQLRGRTLVLKVKLHTYEVLSRQTIPPKAIDSADDLYRYSLPMFTKLQQQIPGIALRLMGLRVTNLQSTKKERINFFKVENRLVAAHQPEGVNQDIHVRPETRASSPDRNMSLGDSACQPANDAAADMRWICPLCAKPQLADDRSFNQHIDFCLSRKAIENAAKEFSQLPARETENQSADERGSELPRKRRKRSLTDAINIGDLRRDPFFE